MIGAKLSVLSRVDNDYLLLMLCIRQECLCLICMHDGTWQVCVYHQSGKARLLVLLLKYFTCSTKICPNLMEIFLWIY